MLPWGDEKQCPRLHRRGPFPFHLSFCRYGRRIAAGSSAVWRGGAPLDRGASPNRAYASAIQNWNSSPEVKAPIRDNAI